MAKLPKFSRKRKELPMFSTRFKAHLSMVQLAQVLLKNWESKIPPKDISDDDDDEVTTEGRGAVSAESLKKWRSACKKNGMVMTALALALEDHSGFDSS